MKKETIVQMHMVIMCSQFEKESRWLNPGEHDKLNGRICSFCEAPLPHRGVRGQSYCGNCPPAGAHRIRMEFHFQQRRWHCEVWDADSGKMPPVRLCFVHAESLYELARRGRGFIGRGKTGKFNFFNAIGAGRGAIDLTLDEHQYQALHTARRTKTPQTSPSGRK